MWMLLLWLSCVADADILFCRLAKFIYFSFRLWSKYVLAEEHENLPHDFTYVGFSGDLMVGF